MKQEGSRDSLALSAHHPVEVPAVRDALQFVLAGVSKVRPEPATRSFTVCDIITALCAANDASANVHRESLGLGSNPRRASTVLTLFSSSRAHGLLPGME
jgi:hypothetical protein